jgi:hypothetical protein
MSECASRMLQQEIQCKCGLTIGQPYRQILLKIAENVYTVWNGIPLFVLFLKYGSRDISAFTVNNFSSV